jgi:hypothetical protein
MGSDVLSWQASRRGASDEPFTPSDEVCAALYAPLSASSDSKWVDQL